MLTSAQLLFWSLSLSPSTVCHKKKLECKSFGHLDDLDQSWILLSFLALLSLLSNCWPPWAFSVSTLYIINLFIKWHYRYVVCPMSMLLVAQISTIIIRISKPSTFVYQRYLVCPCSWSLRSASSTWPPIRSGLSALLSASWQVLLQCHLSHDSSSLGCYFSLYMNELIDLSWFGRIKCGHILKNFFNF